MASKIKSWLNTNIIDKLNTAIHKIPLIGSGISIPHFAKGGIVDTATLGIFGEAGKEAILPLEKDSKGLDLIAERISEKMDSSDANGNGGTYVIYLTLPSGDKITKWIIKNINDYQIKTGKAAF